MAKVSSRHWLFNLTSDKLAQIKNVTTHMLKIKVITSVAEERICLNEAGNQVKCVRTTEGSRVEKTRYDIPIEGGLVVEVDVHRGDLEGHASIEVKGSSAEMLEQISPLEFLRPFVEVTKLLSTKD